MAAASQSKGLLGHLARFAIEADLRNLPTEVVAKAEACLLYAIAVGIAGMGMAQARQAVSAIGCESTGRSTRFFDDRACDAGHAAFANGTLFHARVQDDAHPAGHVGTVVVPAALAVAEASGASGPDLLAAIVAGYEVALRIGRDHATDLSKRGFRTTPAYGAIGAAAAAGRLLRLDDAKMANALSFAANMAAGLREYAEAGTDEYAFQAGTAAANGILAARLAATGATSAPTVLEGAAGFFRAYGEAEQVYGAAVARGLGTDFEMMAVTLKPYPVCQFHRGIIRGAITLRERPGRAALLSLTLRMNPFEADFFGVRFAGPFVTFPQTFMSAPFCVALAWVRGNVTLAGLTDFEALDVLTLVRRVEVIADPDCRRYGPTITARLSDGTELTWHESERSDTYMLTGQSALDMARTLTAEVGVESMPAQALIDAVSRLRLAGGVDAVIAATRAACGMARRR
jgi:2-methylcitrate dehydratase PrpD